MNNKTKGGCMDVPPDYLAGLRRFIETPMGLAISSFCCASLAGISRLLRSDERVTPRYAFAAALHSGLWGLAVALLLDDLVDPGNQHNFLIIAVSIMSGIGGATVTDFVMSLLAKGLSIKVNVGKGDE